ncbi:MAG: hypothetical protein V1821_00555 [bacterium]
MAERKTDPGDMAEVYRRMSKLAGGEFEPDGLTTTTPGGGASPKPVCKKSQRELVNRLIFLGMPKVVGLSNLEFERAWDPANAVWRLTSLEVVLLVERKVDWLSLRRLSGVVTYVDPAKSREMEPAFGAVESQKVVRYLTTIRLSEPGQAASDSNWAQTSVKEALFFFLLYPEFFKDQPKRILSLPGARIGEDVLSLGTDQTSGRPILRSHRQSHSEPGTLVLMRSTRVVPI